MTYIKTLKTGSTTLHSLLDVTTKRYSSRIFTDFETSTYAYTIYYTNKLSLISRNALRSKWHILRHCDVPIIVTTPEMSFFAT